MPDPTLELYRVVVEGLLRAACTRAGVVSVDKRISEAVAALQTCARRMCLPPNGDMQMAVPADELDPLLLTSGLFTGRMRLEFVHRTVGGIPGGGLR